MICQHARIQTSWFTVCRTRPPRRGETKPHGCRHPHDEDDGTRGGVTRDGSKGQFPIVAFAWLSAATVVCGSGRAASASGAFVGVP